MSLPRYSVSVHTKRRAPDSAGSSVTNSFEGATREDAIAAAIVRFHEVFPFDEVGSIIADADPIPTGRTSS